MLNAIHYSYVHGTVQAYRLGHHDSVKCPFRSRGEYDVRNCIFQYCNVNVFCFFFVFCSFMRACDEFLLHSFAINAHDPIHLEGNIVFQSVTGNVHIKLGTWRNRLYYVFHGYTTVESIRLTGLAFTE